MKILTVTKRETKSSMRLGVEVGACAETCHGTEQPCFYPETILPTNLPDVVIEPVPDIVPPTIQ